MNIEAFLMENIECCCWLSRNLRAQGSALHNSSAATEGYHGQDSNNAIVDILVPDSTWIDYLDTNKDADSAW